MSQPVGPPGPYNDPQQPYGAGAPGPYGPQPGGAQPYDNPQPYGAGAPGPYGPQPGGPQPGSPQPYDNPQPYGYPQPPQGFPQQAGHQGYYQGPPYGYAPRVPLPGMPPLASWGARLGAMVLDYLMFSAIPTGLIVAAYARYGIAAVKQLDECDKLDLVGDACPAPHTPGGFLPMMIIGGVLSLIGLVFLSWREGATGQTPGKRIVGIRLLKEYDGANLGFGRALGRRLLHVLDSLVCYIGWLMPLWDAKRQTFADKMVHTVVVRDNS